MSSDEEEDKFKVEEFQKIHEEIEKMKTNESTRGMFVSGWDDDTEGIDDNRNPQGLLETDILKAAENGNLKEVIKLVEKNPKLVFASDEDGYTPLHRACYGNHVDIISYLLSKGANVHARTKLGWEPLHSACKWNNYKCVARLLAAGANINARSDGDQTPLHIAASNSHARATMVLLLADPNVDITILNNSNESAAEIANRTGIFGYLFEMADPAINILKCEAFTHNPLMRESIE